MIKVVCVILICATLLFGMAGWLADREKERNLKTIEFMIEHKLYQPPSGSTVVPEVPEKI